MHGIHLPNIAEHLAIAGQSSNCFGKLKKNLAFNFSEANPFPTGGAAWAPQINNETEIKIVINSILTFQNIFNACVIQI